MEITAKMPWLSSLGQVPATLDYFQGSMFEAVEKIAKAYPNNVAFDFMGKSTTYQDMLEKGEAGIVICPSAELSGTVRSATTALKDFPELDVRIIDSRMIGSNQAMLLKMAKEASDEGKSVDEIETMVREKMKHAKLYAVVDTLEYLYKGGRIGGASKIFGDLLQIKPILFLKDGRVEAFEKQRTKKKALARI